MAQLDSPIPDRIAPEVLYRSLFEHALVEVHIWEVIRDEAGEIVTWSLVDANPAALRSWGRERRELVGKTTEEIFPGANAVDVFLPIVTKIMATGTPHEWEAEFPGTGQVLHMTSFPVGEYFVSTGFDVTQRRRQEQELEHTLQSLEQAVRAGNVGLWDWDLQTDRVRFSDEWKLQLGHAPDEIEGVFEEWRDRLHPDDLEPTLASVQGAIAAAKPSHEDVFRMRHKDGSYRWILAQSAIVVGDDGRPLRMVGSHVDITDRRRLEERIAESQKLESIGTLAAGIAHDFNNLLTAITGNLSLLEEQSGGEPGTLEYLREVQIAAGRARALTSQLLTFAKGGAPVREVASIGELIFESAEFVTRGAVSQVEYDLEKGLANVDADVGQISQVINNLVINANEAMPRGGVIRVGARNVAVPSDNTLDLAPGPYVKVWVTDQGGGIPASELSRIFDPFYTTKDEGSGLGLFTSYSIAAKHGGRLTVESSPGEGSTFTLHLPASTESALPRRADGIYRGSGRLLVMDDTEAVRLVFQAMLRHLGYDCDVAPGGDEGLAMYRDALASGRGYDAVILDLTLPGSQSGDQVLEQLQALDRDVVAIVTSGYAEGGVLADYERFGFRGRVRKPADIAALSREVARVLQDR